MVIKEKEDDFYRRYDLNNLSKDLLLKDPELTVGLARENRDFGEHPLAQDLEILSLCEGKVAWWLSFFSFGNGWAESEAAQVLEVLKLRNGEIAFNLSQHSDVNGWGETKVAEDLSVLRLFDEKVALNLASFCKNWLGRKIVKSRDVRGLCDREVGKTIDQEISRHFNNKQLLL